MADFEIIRRRLSNQHIANPNFTKPQDVVTWLGAVQAQDYAAAKWGVGLRMKEATDALLDEALADGSLLRSHLLRPTWHFASPQDFRWMLDLSAPRLLAGLASMDRQQGLDKAVLKRSHAALIKALKGGRQLTRDELRVVLQKNGITTDDLRAGYLLIHAELDAVICSGGRRGKQFTYALLDERAPHTPTLKRDEALAELAQRYFISRGPATVQDFEWWSGLTLTDARKGLDSVKSKLVNEIVGGQTYWFVDSLPATLPSPTAHLLPNYDEYTVAYADRSAIFETAHTNKLDSRGNILFQHAVVLDGRAAGTWRRTIKKKEVVMELTLFRKLTKPEERAVAAEAERYGNFLGLAVVLAW
jgi:winged helix DNA-binding protein